MNDDESKYFSSDPYEKLKNYPWHDGIQKVPWHPPDFERPRPDAVDILKQMDMMYSRLQVMTRHIEDLLAKMEEFHKRLLELEKPMHWMDEIKK